VREGLALAMNISLNIEDGATCSVLVSYIACRSQAPRGLGHELNGPNQTLGSWI
jgi:hypothetical protein